MWKRQGHLGWVGLREWTRSPGELMLGFTGTLSHQFGGLAQHWEEAGIGRGEGRCWHYLGKRS